MRSLLVLFSLMVLTPAAAAGQEYPVAPDPALCTLDARDLASIQALVDAAASGPAPSTPTPVPNPFVMPDGLALVENERIEIEKDLLRAIGCVNTGDPLKVFAAYTDRYVVELVQRLGGMTDEVVAGLLTVREIESERWLQVLSMDEPTLLDDGRALVVVLGDDPADDQPAGPRAFFLEEVLPGRWLVDDVIEIELPE